MEVRRGDLVSAALPSDYGKPRPVLVIQDDAFNELASVTVLPLTTDMRDFPLFRISVEPSIENGLRQRSQIMADKALTVSWSRIRQDIGRLESARMDEVDVALARFFGLG
jgi:mRNA interferase MazF